ncbi:hypothetical protein ACIGXM_06085 [Kitasatospora sp. NPDC052896]|uniref:hypothetical protein n=1 Tax=Kitasatospora sp. NPDC052896 TaxID=3364061 RepID=UPI0037CA7CC3
MSAATTELTANPATFVCGGDDDGHYEWSDQNTVNYRLSPSATALLYKKYDVYQRVQVPLADAVKAINLCATQPDAAQPYQCYETYDLQVDGSGAVVAINEMYHP